MSPVYRGLQEVPKDYPTLIPKKDDNPFRNAYDPITEIEGWVIFGVFFALLLIGAITR